MRLPRRHRAVRDGRWMSRSRRPSPLPGRRRGRSPRWRPPRIAQALHRDQLSVDDRDHAGTAVDDGRGGRTWRGRGGRSGACRATAAAPENSTTRDRSGAGPRSTRRLDLGAEDRHQAREGPLRGPRRATPSTHLTVEGITGVGVGSRDPIAHPARGHGWRAVWWRRSCVRRSRRSPRTAPRTGRGARTPERSTGESDSSTTSIREAHRVHQDRRLLGRRRPVAPGHAPPQETTGSGSPIRGAPSRRAARVRSMSRATRPTMVSHAEVGDGVAVRAREAQPGLLPPRRRRRRSSPGRR